MFVCFCLGGGLVVRKCSIFNYGLWGFGSFIKAEKKHVWFSEGSRIRVLRFAEVSLRMMIRENVSGASGVFSYMNIWSLKFYGLGSMVA